jgi:protein-disulfide isomerase
MKRKWAVMVIAFLLISCATSGGQQRATIPLDDSPNRGPANAPVTIVEFFDYT